MDPTVTDSLKKIEKMTEIEETISVNPLEEAIVSNARAHAVKNDSLYSITSKGLTAYRKFNQVSLT
jgi:hypothetical protein